MGHAISERSGTITVTMDGQLHFSDNEWFRDMLAGLLLKKPQSVVFDLSKLASVDSVGLGLLCIAREDVESINARFSVASPRGNVARLFDLTGAAQLFDIMP